MLALSSTHGVPFWIWLTETDSLPEQSTFFFYRYEQ